MAAYGTCASWKEESAASPEGAAVYGFGGALRSSQCSTHITVSISTLAFLWPEKLMSGRTRMVCGPLATLNVQLKPSDCTPRSLHPVWSRAWLSVMDLS